MLAPPTPERPTSPTPRMTVEYNIDLMLPLEHRLPGRKYRYNLEIVGENDLTTPANKANVNLIVGE